MTDLARQLSLDEATVLSELGQYDQAAASGGSQDRFGKRVGGNKYRDLHP